MRKLLRSTPFIQKARASAPEYRPEAQEQKFKSWWNRLNSLSSKPASKVYLAQLSNLFAYYNRQVSDNTQVTIRSLSPSTLQPGRARSLQRDWSKKSKKTMKISALKNMTFNASSMVFSAKIPNLSMRLYLSIDSE